MSSLFRYTSVFLAGAVAALVAGVVTLLAAGIGWLIGSAVLAGALSMIVSALLILGFGGLPGWATIVVGLSWAFADTILGALGIGGTAALITMAAAYLVLGLTQGKSREEVLYAGAGPALGAIVGIAVAALLFPQAVAQGAEEAVLSAAMISASRAALSYTQLLRSQGRQDA